MPEEIQRKMYHVVVVLEIIAHQTPAPMRWWKCFTKITMMIKAMCISEVKASLLNGLFCKLSDFIAIVCCPSKLWPIKHSSHLATRYHCLFDHPGNMMNKDIAIQMIPRQTCWIHGHLVSFAAFLAPYFLSSWNDQYRICKHIQYVSNALVGVEDVIHQMNGKYRTA